MRLIGLLARHDRWLEALELIAGLDAGALVASVSAPVDASPQLEARLRSDSAPVLPARPTLDGDALLASWWGRRLVVVVPAGEDMWRIEVIDGGIRGVNVGPARELERLAEELETRPDEASEAAHLLGAALVPEDALDGPPLSLLLIGPVARTPLAALRHDDELVVARVPLVRVLGLLPRPPVLTARTGVAILGDARGDLPAARDEARWVGEHFHVRPSLAGAASRDALDAARGTDLLHVAGHADSLVSGAVLRLADGDLNARDIAEMLPGPRVVVLASCGAAAARDDGGWGSLAAAFLAAGSDFVVASPWAVDDEQTRRLVEAFYAHGGEKDPATALAAAQVELSATTAARAWAGFTVLAAPPRQ
jgi:hypothetical protein